jgi:glycolate oxidase FAD binding subunit
VGVTGPAGIEGRLAEAVAPGTLAAGDRAAAPLVDGLRPRYVATPTSVAGVSRVLAVASAEGLAVVPAGRGVRLGWGAVPRRVDVLLSLACLDRILAHEPADLTLSVEAGATVAAVNAALGAFGQFVPLDPAHPEASTIGGLIATGAAGPYRARYGTLRDLLLGVTVVKADGTVVKGGGRVVKNVSGYDVPKLYVGALGTLGVVVEANLRLHPRPAEERSWVFGFGSLEAAVDAATRVRDTAVVLSRCQFLDAGALRALGEPAPPAAALAVTIGSVPEAVADQARRVAEICAASGAEAIEVPAADAWWRQVAEVPWPRDPEASLVLRIGTRPTDVAKALRAVEAAAPGEGRRATAEAANGVLHVSIDGVDPGRVGGLVARIRAGMAELGGTCAVEHAPAAAKASLDVWGDVGPALPLMRRLKAELDPAGVLNPGRYVGGI